MYWLYARLLLLPLMIKIDLITQKPYTDPAGAVIHRENVIGDVFLRLYTGNTTAHYADIRLLNSVDIFNQPTFNRTNPTLLYIHGYTETPYKESVQVVISSYLETKQNYNLLLLDWSNMAFGSYFFNAVPNSKNVAFAAARELKKIIDRGLDSSLIHIVGHSLGGQIAGFVGNQIQKYGVKLPRITGLDPAFPMFYPGVKHIRGSDADTVDIIHTDAGNYGAPESTGTVDFWPNGGTYRQPGCPSSSLFDPLSDDAFCSHWRSWRFYAESVRNPEAFPAVPAGSYGDFKRTNTQQANISECACVYMGFRPDPSARGNYYLTTNGASPYGKGLPGTTS